MADSYSFLSDIVASDQGNLDIRAYTSKIKDELSRLEGQCLGDYLMVSPAVTSLNNDIDEALDVLGRIEGVVDRYQEQITDVSSQVKQVQAASKALNRSLSNRRDLEKIVHGYLEAVLLSRESVDLLRDGDIDTDAYLAEVQSFSEKLQRAASGELAESAALAEVRPELDKL